jgi:hypothetical protein
LVLRHWDFFSHYGLELSHFRFCLLAADPLIIPARSIGFSARFLAPPRKRKLGVASLKMASIHADMRILGAAGTGTGRDP